MRPTSSDLEEKLRKIDGKGYKAYKQIQGVYDFEDFTLRIDHVQGDPFAPPSRVSVTVDHTRACFPPDTYSNRSRRIGLADFLLREFSENARQASRICGIGNSGLITIDRPGQEILERTAMMVNEEKIEARFAVGLPAKGRTILAQNAIDIFLRKIPNLVMKTLFLRADRLKGLTSKTDRNGYNRPQSKSLLEKIYAHIAFNEDADWIRNRLASMDLVAFVADGSILPRRSGVDNRPMEPGKVIRFVSPSSLRVALDVPNKQRILGMGIPRGITLIVGGGYHGKSTLLNAIQAGVYNHIPGDGREFVITDHRAVKIRAEDGRRVEKVNISPFVSNLPYGQDTTRFSTDNASGSTSQAANIIEALEAGATLFLIDEDTAATNFMIRDRRMQMLIPKEKEPITPFIDNVRRLYEERGVSTILVTGGSGDYLDVADVVIGMDCFVPCDLSEDSRTIAQLNPTQRTIESQSSFRNIVPRVPLSKSINPSKGKRQVKITVHGTSAIIFGRYTIDISRMESVVHPSQARAIGQAINYIKKYMDGNRTIPEIIDALFDEIERKGLAVIDERLIADYAMPRRIELAGAINRLPTLTVL